MSLRPPFFPFKQNSTVKLNARKTKQNRNNSISTKGTFGLYSDALAWLTFVQSRLQLQSQELLLYASSLLAAIHDYYIIITVIIIVIIVVVVVLFDVGN